MGERDDARRALEKWVGSYFCTVEVELSEPATLNIESEEGIILIAFRDMDELARLWIEYRNADD